MSHKRAAPGASSFLAGIPSSGAPRVPNKSDPQGFTRIGSIVRVKMIDFMIYTLEEMFPGPGLNLLLGPNGSGKSTCVSAIGIALAGDTASVGRFDHLGEYVKRGSTKAAVEVELFGGGPGGKNLIVQRSFESTGGDKSKFFLNGVGVGKKDVQAKMSQLNIQVNNLCVYLAQFRVGKFAEMNHEQMLIETEKAADLSLHRRHVELNEMSGNLKSGSERIAQSQRLFDSLHAEVSNMEAERKAEEERQEAVQKISDLRHRKQWAIYDQLEGKVRKAEEQRAACQRRLEEERQREAPLRNALQKQKTVEAAATKRHGDLLGRQRSMKASRLEHEASVADLTSRVDSCEAKLEDLDSDVARRKRDLDKEKLTLSKLQEAQGRLRPDAEIDAELRQVDKLRIQGRQELHAHNHQMSGFQTGIADAELQKNHAQNRLASARARPVNDSRQRLLRIDRGNRHRKGTIDSDQIAIDRARAEGKLKSHVYGPLLAELTVTDPQAAVFVEEIVGNKWATSWVVDNQSDMKVLYDAGVQGSIIFAQDSTGHQAARPFNLEPFRQYGVFYLEDTIQCAPLVLSALRDVVSIGMHVFAQRPPPPDVCQQLMSTKKNDGKLRSLYTSQAHYGTSQSQWTNNVAVNVNPFAEGRTARVLGAAPVDPHLQDEMKKAEDEIKKADETMRELHKRRLEVHTAWEKDNALREQMTLEVRQRFTDLSEERQRAQRLAGQILTSQSAIQKLEKHLDMRREKEALRKEIAQLEKKREDTLAQLMSCVSSFQETVALAEAHVHAVTAQSMLAHMQATIDNLGDRRSQLQAELDEAKRKLVSAQKDTETQKRVAQNACDRAIFDGIAWLNEFERTHGAITVEVIDAKILELENALKRAVGDADIIRRYDVKKAALDEADIRLQLDKGKLDTLQGDIDRLQSEWLSGVTKMTETIHKHFARYFERIGCSGSVKLEADGSKYGILISVSFRKGTALQPLSGTSQSGGEKSVATMLYLLCLQEVTNTPFRMVDEINQGMDANNERLIFNQIVRSCEEARTDDQGERIEPPQYFVVTPKLLPNLRFSDRVSVFNVCNGPLMLPQIEWDLGKFLRIARSGQLEEAQARKKRRLAMELQEEHMRSIATQPEASQQ